MRQGKALILRFWSGLARDATTVGSYGHLEYFAFIINRPAGAMVARKTSNLEALGSSPRSGVVGISVHAPWAVPSLDLTFSPGWSEDSHVSALKFG